MCVWRAFYAIYLDLSSFRGVAAARRDRGKDMQHFADSLKSAMLLSLAFCAVLQVRVGQGARARVGCYGIVGVLRLLVACVRTQHWCWLGQHAAQTHNLLALPPLTRMHFCSAWAAW